MKLDLRRPTLVLAGAWNPAIFEPAWIARHVFGMPTGVEFTVGVAQMVADGEPKLAIYIHDVGFSVSPGRLEMFTRYVGEAAFNAVESATAKIIELLPHTPISAYGINFRFVEEAASPDLLEKIRGHDELEKRFDVTKETISSTINFEPSVQLTLQRQNDGAGVVFDFNFHLSGVDTNTFVKGIHGEIQVRLGQALSIMEGIYRLSGYEVLMHEFDPAKEGDSDAVDK